MSNQQAKSYNLSFVLSVSRSISAVCVHPESLSHPEREMSFALFKYQVTFQRLLMSVIMSLSSGAGFLEHL